MKTIYLLILGLALTGWSFGQNQATQLEAAYQQGINAVRNGEVDIARNAFLAVLEIDPRHANARYQLRQLKLEGGKLSVRKRQLAFERVIVPEINLEQASVKEALEALGAIVTRESNKKFATNFIVRDPAGLLAKREISLNLRNTPASVVLKYIVEQVGAMSRIDDHAIVVFPPAGAKAPSAKTEPGDDDNQGGL